MEKGLISIIIPNYNYEHYLPETIESVITQTYKKWELIIVDDNSSDGSRDVVNRYIKEYPQFNIRLIHNHSGPSGTAIPLNVGIRNMMGEYFAWLSSDDLYKKDILAEQMKVMEEDAQTGMVFTDFDYIDDRGNITLLEFPDYQFPHRYEAFARLVRGSYIKGATILIRKTVMDAAGPFVEGWDWLPRIWMGAEYLKWFDLAVCTKITYLSKKLQFTRRHAVNSIYYQSGFQHQLRREIAEAVSRKYPPQELARLLNIEENHPARVKVETAVFLKLLYSGKVLELNRRLELLKRTASATGEKVMENLDKIDRLRTIAGLCKFFIMQKMSYTEVLTVPIDPNILEYLENDQLYSIASAYKKCDQNAVAVILFETLLNAKTPIDQFIKGAHFHLGELYYSEGKYPQAREQFCASLRYYPGHQKASQYLERLQATS